VLVDNVLASFQAARHLIELGHERIGVIAGPQTILTGAQRLEGFRQALQEAHLALPARYVRSTSFATEPAYRAALEVLQVPNPPTAVFACNNRMTMGLMRALRHLGLRCPQDVSVVGFDDFEWSELFNPRLTTVVQPSHQMGEVAAEMLIETLMSSDQRAESGERKCTVLKAELRVRESTAPPGGQAIRGECGGLESRSEGMMTVPLDGGGERDK
jgi:LacI family transcriptional regulator